MSIDDYIDALQTKLDELENIITASSLQREIDTNVAVGFVRGQITFVDGSRFEFTEQLPTTRQKFRLHYMDAQNNLIARWDSAPHHKELSTFPFHKHTPQEIQAHAATTTLEILNEIARLVKA